MSTPREAYLDARLNQSYQFEIISATFSNHSQTEAQIMPSVFN